MDASNFSGPQAEALNRYIEQKQMKDFMKLYSGLVERCFTACCNDFTSRALSSKEVRPTRSRRGEYVYTTNDEADGFLVFVYVGRVCEPLRGKVPQAFREGRRQGSQSTTRRCRRRCSRDGASRPLRRMQRCGIRPFRFITLLGSHTMCLASSWWQHRNLV